MSARENQIIFISYSRLDGEELAFSLTKDLRNDQVEVWIDQANIHAGREWDFQIEEALNKCSTLLFIVTKHSIGSKNVLDEVYYVLNQKKRVLPIILQESPLPFRLQRLQNITFTGDYKTSYQRLLSSLRSDVGFELPRKARNQKTLSVWFGISLILNIILGLVLYLNTESAESAEQKRIRFLKAKAGDVNKAAVYDHYSETAQMLTPELVAVIPEPVFHSRNKFVKNLLGEFLRPLDTTYSNHTEGEKVSINNKYERGIMALEITFNREGGITGLISNPR